MSRLEEMRVGGVSHKQEFGRWVEVREVCSSLCSVIIMPDRYISDLQPYGQQQMSCGSQHLTCKQISTDRLYQSCKVAKLGNVRGQGVDKLRL